MSIALVVLLAAAGAALLAFAVSASRASAIDPIDPAVEEAAVSRAIDRRAHVKRFLRERLDRNSAGGFLLTMSFVVVFGVALVLGLLLDLIDESSRIAELDDAVSEWGAAHASSAAVDALEWITHLGATPVAAVVLIAAATYDFLRHRNATVFGFVVAVWLGELLLNNGLKMLVSRERPAVLQLVGAHGYSFPSGHSAAAAATWSAVALILGRGQTRRVRAGLAAGAALVAAAVATSRALLGVHWVTDVVGGLAVGWGWFLLVAIAFGGRVQRLGDPVARTAQPPRPGAGEIRRSTGQGAVT